MEVSTLLEWSQAGMVVIAETNFGKMSTFSRPVVKSNFPSSDKSWVHMKLPPNTWKKYFRTISFTVSQSHHRGHMYHMSMSVRGYARHGHCSKILKPLGAHHIFFLRQRSSDLPPLFNRISPVPTTLTMGTKSSRSLTEAWSELTKLSLGFLRFLRL